MEKIVLANKVEIGSKQLDRLFELRSWLAETYHYRHGLTIRMDPQCKHTRTVCIEAEPLIIFDAQNNSQSDFERLGEILLALIGPMGYKLDDWRVRRVEYSYVFPFGGVGYSTYRSIKQDRPLQTVCQGQVLDDTVLDVRPGAIFPRVELLHRIYKPGIMAQTLQSVTQPPTYALWANSEREQACIDAAARAVLGEAIDEMTIHKKPLDDKLEGMACIFANAEEPVLDW